MLYEVVMLQHMRCNLRSFHRCGYKFSPEALPSIRREAELLLREVERIITEQRDTAGGTND